jgi:hypothetical protein
MKLTLIDNLPFETVALTYHGKTIQIDSVLINTGSATTILSADDVASIDIYPSPEDRLYPIRGVGGNEVVFSRVVDQLRVGEQGIPGFEVEIGGMDYGFDIHGILGMDFLTRVGAIINFRNMTISFGSR